MGNVDIIKDIVISPVRYKDFVLEEAHGFNKKTYNLFFMDLLKSEGLMCAIFAVLLPYFARS